VFGTRDRLKDALEDFRKQNVPFSIVFGAAIRPAHGWGQKNYSKRFPLSSPAFALSISALE
jgi:hypothetical protein